ncbi:MAG: hypothetical protein MJE77_07035 [Proteobacteria bacterium]|nr:hypothetical protein [Pseudomonadota bacterium]
MPTRARAAHSAFAALSALLVFLAACGGPPAPPRRGVLEQDVSAWNYRRYQKLLDVEVWVAKNRAVAFAASYVREQAEKRGIIEDRDIVTALVTRYQHNRGVLRALVKFARRLAQDSGYVVDEDSRGQVRFISVKGHGETWALWMSNRHIVKIGRRSGDSVPGDLIQAYGQRYPSRLKEGILDGPLPQGPDFDQSQDDETYDPDNPTPDWEEYETGDNIAPDSRKSN